MTTNDIQIGDKWVCPITDGPEHYSDPCDCHERSRFVETTAAQMNPGDVLCDTGVGPVEQFTVTAVQILGSLVIVDFADGTATPPIPGVVPVRVRRHDR